MIVRVLVRKFQHLAIVRFVGLLPDGFRAFTLPEMEVPSIYCYPNGRGGYDFLAASVACDFLRDHGYTIEPFSPDSDAEFREVVNLPPAEPPETPETAPS